MTNTTQKTAKFTAQLRDYCRITRLYPSQHVETPWLLLVMACELESAGRLTTGD